MNICEYCNGKIDYNPKGFDAVWVMTATGLRHVECINKEIFCIFCEHQMNGDLNSWTYFGERPVHITCAEKNFNWIIGYRDLICELEWLFSHQCINSIESFKTVVENKLRNVEMLMSKLGKVE